MTHDATKFDHQSMDAVVWAKEFVRINPNSTPEDVMLAWFANAIMAGFDEARRRYDPEYRRSIDAALLVAPRRPDDANIKEAQLLNAKEALLAEVWVQGRAGNIAAMIEHVVHAAQEVVLAAPRREPETPPQVEDAYRVVTCDCGTPVTMCVDCAVADYQAAHTDCRTCCPTQREPETVQQVDDLL